MAQPASEPRLWRRVLNDVATLAIILMCITVIWFQFTRGGAVAAPRSPAVATNLVVEPIRIVDGATLGRADAPVIVMEFSDLQCPFCAKFTRDSFPTIRREYIDNGRVQLWFRHLPLDRIHPRARPAALAAECARSGGRFWEMHDRLFANPNRLEDADLASHAQALGLRDFQSCLSSDVDSIVRRDVEAARDLGVSSTPTFVIARRLSDSRARVLAVLAGASSLNGLRSAFDSALAPRSGVGVAR